MRATKLLFAVLLVALAAVPATFASVPVVHVLGGGSSAVWQPTGVAAANDIAKLSPTCAGGVGTSCAIHHWTLKNGADCTAVSGGGCTELFDNRVSGGTTPGLQGGNIWIVWVTCLVAADCPSYAVGAATDVWSDVQIDSTVGVRVFLARGASGGVATQLQLAGNVQGPPFSPAQQSDNAISQLLLANGVAAASSGTNCTAATNTCDDKYVPADVYTALTTGTSSTLTTGFTDIRMEDAKYATKRINKPFDTGGYFLGLGYSTAGSALVGNLIHSGISTATAEPDNFALPGSTDPFNGSAVPTTITTLPIGEAPIIFVANRSNTSNLGVTLNGQPYYNNLWDTVPNTPGSGYVTKLGKLFFGKDCSGAAAAFWNTGVVGPQPPGGNPFTTLANQVWKIVSPGNGGLGTLDIKIDPTGSTGLWGYLAGAPPISDGMGIVLSGTSDGAGHNWDGVYQVVAGGVSGESGVGLDFTDNKIEVTAWSGFNTGGSQTIYQQAPEGTLAPPEATLSYWTPGAGFNIHVLIREPLSGTYNTTEFTSIREFGGPTGFAGGSNTAGAAASNKSQESDYSDINVGNVPAQMPNPVAAHPCWWSSAANTPPSGSGFGDRTRVVGTGEMVSGAGGAGGIQHTADALGYTFFSFGNVSAIGKSNNYGYLQIDGVDGLFNSYVGAAGFDPGEPNGNVAGALAGQLPKCDLTGVSAPFCKASSIWDTTHACAGGAANPAGCSYPHLRDGTYRAWSLIRALCDTANTHCLKASDNLGTEGLIAAAQDDIHNNTGVPDFLPFSDDGSFGPAGNTGDAVYMRSHFVPGLYYDNNVYNYSSQVSFFTPGVGFGENPEDSPEAGGDVGGCIILIPDSSNTQINCQQ
jgi:hypothetical protein